MDTHDGWPKVWPEMTDEELRDRLRHLRLFHFFALVFRDWPLLTHFGMLVSQKFHDN